MPTLYFKDVVYNGGLAPWGEVGNWFTNTAATVQAVDIPWVSDNLYKTYDLALATGVVVTPTAGEDLGSGSFGNGFSITGSCGISFIAGFDAGEGQGQLLIYSGTFNQPVTGFTLEIHGGTFQSTVTSSGNTYIYGGTFNGPVNNAGMQITGGVFNGAFTQVNNLVGGTFNGTFTRVSGNVTGGTFNNGIIYQFFRNGFPPPIAFGGYNPNALDVLGTGML